MSDSPFNYREYLAEHPELYEQLNLKNTTEDDMGTFCDIISHLKSKYRANFLGLRKLLDRSGPDFDEHSVKQL